MMVRRDSEQHLALFATYINKDGSLKMLSCAVREGMDEDTLFAEALDETNKFCGFTAGHMFTCLIC